MIFLSHNTSLSLKCTHRGYITHLSHDTPWIVGILRVCIVEKNNTHPVCYFFTLTHTLLFCYSREVSRDKPVYYKHVRKLFIDRYSVDMPVAINLASISCIYRKISNRSRTKSQNEMLFMSTIETILPNPLKSVIWSRE